MARIRSVKPSLRTSRTVARWRFEVRYFWVLLWGYLDDKGRGLDIPKAIAGDCFPLDDKITAGTINRWLGLMATTKVDEGHDPPLCRYEVGGRRYIHSVYWDEHCRPNRPSPSLHPPCPIHESLTEPFSESDTEPPLSRHVLELEGLKLGSRNREVETAGREPITEPPTPTPLGPEPPPRCENHLNDEDPPNCRACQKARLALEAWLDRHAKLERDQAALERSRQAHEMAEYNRVAIANCRDCDQRGYLPNGKPCPHDPGANHRTQRGAAVVRETLKRRPA